MDIINNRLFGNSRKNQSTTSSTVHLFYLLLVDKAFSALYSVYSMAHI